MMLTLILLNILAKRLVFLCKGGYPNYLKPLRVKVTAENIYSFCFLILYLENLHYLAKEK